jgi:hypothetical protein
MLALLRPIYDSCADTRLLARTYGKAAPQQGTKPLALAERAIARSSDCRNLQRLLRREHSNSSTHTWCISKPAGKVTSCDCFSSCIERDALAHVHASMPGLSTAATDRSAAHQLRARTLRAPFGLPSRVSATGTSRCPVSSAWRLARDPIAAPAATGRVPTFQDGVCDERVATRSPSHRSMAASSLTPSSRPARCESAR